MFVTNPHLNQSPNIPTCTSRMPLCSAVRKDSCMHEESRVKGAENVGTCTLLITLLQVLLYGFHHGPFWVALMRLCTQTSWWSCLPFWRLKRWTGKPGSVAGRNFRACSRDYLIFRALIISALLWLLRKC